MIKRDNVYISKLGTIEGRDREDLRSLNSGIANGRR